MGTGVVYPADGSLEQLLPPSLEQLLRVVGSKVDPAMAVEELEGELQVTWVGVGVGIGLGLGGRGRGRVRVRVRVRVRGKG